MGESKGGIASAAATVGSEYARSAPQWFTVVVIVSLFLGYLYFHEKSSVSREAYLQKQVDTVSQLRIDQCHAIQEASVMAIQQMTETTREHVVAFDRLREAIEDLEAAIKEKR